MWRQWYTAAMAILKFGTIVVAARGTIGGLTISANKAGPYGKPWASPPRQNTPKQSTARARFASLKFQWQALTPSERTDWDDFAALPGQELTNPLGDAYYLSGWQWFTKINQWRVQPYTVPGYDGALIAPDYITAPPAGGPATAPTLTDLEAHYDAPDNLIVSYSAPVIGANEFMLFEAQQIYSPSQIYAPPRLHSIFAIAQGDTSPITIQTTIASTLGEIIPGAQVLLRVYMLPADGYRSAPAEIRATTEE